jgi:hypothetical protein
MAMMPKIIKKKRRMIAKLAILGTAITSACKATFNP